MQKLLASLLCFSIVALIATAGGAGANAQKIEGTWTATGGFDKGEKIPDDLLKKVKITAVFKEGKYQVTLEAQGKSQVLESGTYKTDSSKQPATIDMNIEKGKDQGKSQLGLYKLEGDNLTLIVNLAGSTDRPKSFEPAKDNEVNFMKRAK